MIVRSAHHLGNRARCRQRRPCHPERANLSPRWGSLKNLGGRTTSEGDAADEAESERQSDPGRAPRRAGSGAGTSHKVHKFNSLRAMCQHGTRSTRRAVSSTLTRGERQSHVVFVIGIDAGGTKTVCQLADKNGAVIQRRAAPARTSKRSESSRSRKCSMT